MKILMIASEVEGLVKTGGLADVAYALPKALQAMGHEVQVIMPAYRKIAGIWQHWSLSHLNMELSFFNTENVGIRSGEHNGLPLIAIEHPESFDRDGLYDDGDNAYQDNPYRFGILSKAALVWCKENHWQPDIVHTNDWPSSMACFYLAEHFKDDPFFANTRSVLSIHNGAYQMQCDPWWAHRLGIHERFFNAADFEDCGNLNILKGCIGFADGVSTVSPGYASELMTMLGGHGLHDKYGSLSRPVTGILNGCDYSQWDPERDSWLVEGFDSASHPGRLKNKLGLQAEVGFEQNEQTPLLGTICRLVDQKGIHLLIPVAMELMRSSDCQIVVLGSGDKRLAGQLDHIQREYPHRFHFINGYDIGLSHRIEAGVDAFLMPSVFEPCGLNQIYSLRYGSVPLVRKVGGLQDTVNRLHDDFSNLHEATGFMFSDLSYEAMLAETQRMVSVFKHNPNEWRTLQNNGMSQRFTWDKSGKIYEDYYQELLHSPKVSHPLL